MLRDPPRERRRRDGRRSSPSPRIRRRRSASSRWTTPGASCTSTRSRRADRLPGLLSELPGGGTRLPRVDGHLPLQARGPGAGASPTRSWSTSAATSSPTRCRASACRRTSTAATGRTSGPSSRTSRPTWRCATRSRRLISTTRSARSTPTRASCPRRSWRAATSSSALISEGCILHGAEIDRAVIGIRSRIGAGVAHPQQPAHRRRLLRDAATRCDATRGARRPAGRHRRGLGHRERDHRQERAHRPRRPHRQRGGHQERRRRRLLHPRGDRDRPQERRASGTAPSSSDPLPRRGWLGEGHVPLRRPRRLALRAPQDDPRHAGGRRHAGRRDRVARRRQGRRGGARARHPEGVRLVRGAAGRSRDRRASTTRCPTTCTCPGPSARPPPASTCWSRSRSRWAPPRRGGCSPRATRTGVADLRGGDGARAPALAGRARAGAQGQDRRAAARSSARSATTCRRGATTSASTPDMGGGVLLDIGFYPVTMSRFCFDDEPTAVVAAHGARLRTRASTCMTSAILRFPRGHAIFTCGMQLAPAAARAAPGQQGAHRPRRTPGTPPPTSRRSWCWRPAPASRRPPPSASSSRPSTSTRSWPQLFARAAATGGPAPIPLEDSIKNMAVLDALRRSAASGRWETRLIGRGGRAAPVSRRRVRAACPC